MSKNIILCADGTWNGLGASDGPDLDPRRDQRPSILRIARR